MLTDTRLLLPFNERGWGQDHPPGITECIQHVFVCVGVGMMYLLSMVTSQHNR